MTHQFSPVLEALGSALKDAAHLDPVLLAPDEVGQTLLALRSLQDQLGELCCG